MRNLDNWEDRSASGGTVIMSGRTVNAVAVSGSERAMIRRVIPVAPGSVVTAKVKARVVSGDARINIDKSSGGIAGANVSRIALKSGGLQEYQISYAVPITGSVDEVIVAMGVGLDQVGEADLYDPQILIDGVDIDSQVHSANTPTGGYTKLVGGALICWAHDLTFSRDTAHSLKCNWVPPHPFEGKYNVSYCVDAVTDITGSWGASSLGVMRVNNSTNDLYINRSSESPDFPPSTEIRNVRVTAIGQWR